MRCVLGACQEDSEPLVRSDGGPSRINRSSTRQAMRRWIVMVACVAAITAAVGPPLSGAPNPSLLFATPLTTGGAIRSAIDARGFIYLAGNVAEGTLISARAAFVTKLTPDRKSTRLNS